ncbi:hypothetical protein LTR53_004783 [Teratosphaeriaceae sp. CCFEE 6253]|nr:hypothetical protein LTR53_004783 [Teratosphaeriaceae sp. CCFEE 6253]
MSGQSFPPIATAYADPKARFLCACVPRALLEQNLLDLGDDKERMLATYDANLRILSSGSAIHTSAKRNDARWAILELFQVVVQDVEDVFYEEERIVRNAEIGLRGARDDGYASVTGTQLLEARLRMLREAADERRWDVDALRTRLLIMREEHANAGGTINPGLLIADRRLRDEDQGPGDAWSETDASMQSVVYEPDVPRSVERPPDYRETSSPSLEIRDNVDPHEQSPAYSSDPGPPLGQSSPLASASKRGQLTGLECREVVEDEDLDSDLRAEEVDLPVQDNLKPGLGPTVRDIKLPDLPPRGSPVSRNQLPPRPPLLSASAVTQQRGKTHLELRGTCVLDAPGRPTLLEQDQACPSEQHRDSSDDISQQFAEIGRFARAAASLNSDPGAPAEPAMREPQRFGEYVWIIGHGWQRETEVRGEGKERAL